MLNDSVKENAQYSILRAKTDIPSLLPHKGTGKRNIGSVVLFSDRMVANCLMILSSLL